MTDIFRTAICGNFNYVKNSDIYNILKMTPFFHYSIITSSYRLNRKYGCVKKSDD